MKKTLQIINSLVESDIINEYAIAGGMAQFYYVEPSVTYDLDLIVNSEDTENSLTPLTSLYKWAKENNFKSEGEHIVIGGIPVQFLLPYNNLISEALKNRTRITIFEENTFIVKAEYLMAIMLQTGRATDKERLLRFFIEAAYDEKVFLDILKRFELVEQYNRFREHYRG
jgi:hypothetical protein